MKISKNGRDYTGKFEVDVELKTLRVEKGLSIKKASEILEVPYRTYQNWENGYSKCPTLMRKCVMSSLKSYKSKKTK